MSNSTSAGRALANTSVAVLCSVLLSKSAGPVASNPRDHQASPPELTSASSTAHDGSVARTAMPATIRPLASWNWLIRRLLRTTDQADGLASYGPRGPNGNDHFRQDSRRPR